MTDWHTVSFIDETKSLIAELHCLLGQEDDMTALARWCFTRRAWILVAWLALLVILGVAGRAAGAVYSDSLTLPGTGSPTALTILENAFPGHAGDQATIGWRPRSGSV